MKKFICFFLSFILVLSFVGCVKVDENITHATQTATPKETTAPEEVTLPEETMQPEVVATPLQDGYCWVYGSGMEAVAFAEVLTNPDHYYIYDLDSDGLGEVILAENGQPSVVYKYKNGAVSSSAAKEDLSSILSGLTALSGYESLSGIYTEQGKVQAPVVDVFSQTDENQFTNGRETFAALDNGTVLLVDMTIPSVKIYSQLKHNENILGVTQNMVYFTYYDEDFGIGVEIYTLDRNGNAGKNYGNLRSGFYLPGYVLIQNHRTDVSPTVLSIYNNDDEVVVDNVCAWSAIEDNGAIYYTELGRDPYADFSNKDPLSLKLVRLNTDGLTVTLELSVSPDHISSIYAGRLMIMDFGIQTFYDLTTGQIVEQKLF